MCAGPPTVRERGATRPDAKSKSSSHDAVDEAHEQIVIAPAPLAHPSRTADLMADYCQADRLDIRIYQVAMPPSLTSRQAE